MLACEYMKQRTFRKVSTDTPKSYPTKEMRELYLAILKIKTVDECATFFRDLLTMAEITEFANRWQTVKLLRKGVPYATIAAKLKISSATVTRVAYWLKNGMGGYQAIADRMFENTSEKPEKRHRLHGKRWLA